MIFLEKNKKYRLLLQKIIKENDQRAFNVFYDHYYKMLVRYSYRIIGKIEVCEDLVTDLMLRFLGNGEKSMNILNLDNYLFHSVKNESLKYIERNKLVRLDSEHTELKSSTVDPHQQFIFDELQSILEEAIATLPDKRKQIFNLIRFEGLKYREVSERLGISVKTVENQMCKAISQLREIVENYYREKYPSQKEINYNASSLMLLLLLVSGFSI